MNICIFWLLFFFFFGNFCIGLRNSSLSCPCEDESLCKGQVGKIKGGTNFKSSRESDRFPRQVMAYCEKDGNWWDWPWNNLDAAIMIDYHSDELMCHAHKLGVQYGLLITSFEFHPFDSTASISDTMNEFAAKLLKQRQDIIFFDLDAIFQNLDEYDKDFNFEFLRDVTYALRRALPYLKIGVLHRPERFALDNQCDHVRDLAGEMDYIVMTHNESSKIGSRLSPAFQTDYSFLVALPVSPYISVITDIERYIMCGVPSYQIILQVPWQAVSYICSQLISSNDTCIQSGKQAISLSQLSLLKRNVNAVSQWNITFKAPYFNYINYSSNKWHQVWHENSRSLEYKSWLIEQLHLAGVVIAYSDIVNASHDVENISNSMWKALISHLHTDETTMNKKEYRESQQSIRSKTLGLTIGLFLFGLIMGMSLMAGAYVCRRKVYKFKPIDMTEELVFGEHV